MKKRSGPTLRSHGWICLIMRAATLPALAQQSHVHFGGDPQSKVVRFDETVTNLQASTGRLGGRSM